MSEELSVTLGLNTKSFNSAIKTVNQELKFLDKEFNETKKSVENFEKSIEGQKLKLESLNKKYETQSTKLKLYREEIERSKKALESKKQKLNELTSAEELNEKAIAKTTKEIDTMTTRLHQLENNANLTELEMKNLASEIDSVGNSINKVETKTLSDKLNTVSTKMKDTGQKFKDVGSTISETGKNLSLKVTTPILGVATASVKCASTFQSSMSNVQALSGATGNDLKELENKAKEMGEKTSKSASECADAMGYMALAGWSNKEMLTGLEPILRLSEIGNIQLSRASDLVTDSMSSLGITTDELSDYLDKVAKTQASANTSAEGLMDAYITVGGTLKNLKVPLDESSALLGVLANRGLKSSEAGNSLNSVLVNLMGTSGQSSEALKLLGVSAWDTDGNFKGVEKTIMELDNALNNCTEEQKNMFIAMIGGKTQMDTLNALIDGMNNEYFELKGSIQNSNGALDEMASIMQDNLQGKTATLKSKLESLGISVGEKLIPHLITLIDKIMGVLDWFGSLDDGTQTMILKIGLLTATIPPLLVGVGSVISSIGGIIKAGGSLVGLLGKIVIGSTATTGSLGTVASATAGVTSATATASGVAGLGGLISSLGSTALACAPFVAGATAVAGAGLLVAKELKKEVVPSVDLFEDVVETATVTTGNWSGQVVVSSQQISESTKNAVQSYIDMDDGVTKSLENLYINGTTITRKTCDELTNSYKTMGDTITAGIKNNKAQDLQTLQEYLSSANDLSAKEKEQLINDTKTAYDNKSKTVNEQTAKIKSILTKASNEKRELTIKEMNEIDSIQKKMKENAIKTLSANEVESNAILDRMKAYDKRVTAEQCAQHVKELNNARDKAIKSADEEYNKRVNTIAKMRDELGSISSATADKMIANAKKQRDGSVKAIEETRNKSIEKMKGLNSNLEKEVDLSTGKIQTKWDKLKNWWANWFPSKKTFNVEVNEKTNKSNESSKGKSIPQIANINPINVDVGGIPTAQIEMPETFKNMMVRGSYFDMDSKVSKRVISDGVNKSSYSQSNAILKVLNAIENKLNGDTSTNINIETFVNNREQDIAQLCREMEYYRRKTMY